MSFGVSMTVPGMATAPILRQASIVSHHSGRRPTWMKTRSPFFTPLARRTLTTRLASSDISFQEIARSPPESSIQRMHRRSEDHFSNVSVTKLNRAGTVSMAATLRAELRVSCGVGGRGRHSVPSSWMRWSGSRAMSGALLDES